MIRLYIGLMKFIFFPIGNIVLDVIVNFNKFIVISDDSVVKSCLPSKIYAILFGEITNGSFENTYYVRKASALLGNIPHHFIDLNVVICSLLFIFVMSINANNKMNVIGHYYMRYYLKIIVF